MNNGNRSHMTHNGAPWASNIGSATGGLLDALFVRKGQEAALRYHDRTPDQQQAVAGTVAGLWLVLTAMRIIQWFSIVNNTWLTAIGFYHGTKRGLICLALFIPGVACSLLCLSAGKALLRRAERLPAKRDYKLRGSFWIWMLLFWGPSFAYSPFYTQVPH